MGVVPVEKQKAMQKQQDNDGELSTWNEIADYLGVSVRQAQQYEHLNGLPVHRMPGKKTRVWANTRELDGWKQARRALAAAERAPLAAAVAGEQAVSLGPARRRKWYSKGALLMAFVLAVGLVAFSRIVVFDRKPASFLVRGRTLIVSNAAGQELWRFGYEHELSENAYNDPGDSLRFKRCVLADIDGDGTVEVVLAASPVNYAVLGTEVICLSQSGQVRWRWRPGRQRVTVAGREFVPPYYVNTIEVVRRKEPKGVRLVISSNHNWSFPNQIAVIDPTGVMVGEYWHYGHLLRAAQQDLNGDGQPEVLLAGVLDDPSHDQATVVGFDVDHISGSSQAAAGDIHFDSFGPSTEILRILFPKSCLAQRFAEFNRALHLRLTDSAMTVFVAETVHDPGPNDRIPYLVYDFDRRLILRSVSGSDHWHERHRLLEAQGLLDHRASQEEIEALKAAVIVRRKP